MTPFLTAIGIGFIVALFAFAFGAARVLRPEMDDPQSDERNIGVQ